MAVKIVIFDLDGTLLYTLEDLTDSTNFALKQFNFPAKNINEVQTIIGNGVAKLIERAIPQGKTNQKFTECLEIFKQHYSMNMYNKTKPYDNIVQTLQNIKNKNIKIAVVSNKFDYAVNELCKKYFPDLIDFSVGENETKGIHKKPAPDSIFKILEMFNISKEEAIYIGDSEVDIQTAKNAGIKCICVSWGYKSKEFLQLQGAKVIVNDPNEILKFL